MVKSIGIDLGTTNSCFAAELDGVVKIVIHPDGKNVLPSVVSLKDGHKIVGGPAKRQKVTNPENTVYSVKKLMGTGKKVKIGHEEYTPEQISALILQQGIKNACKFLKDEIKDAVITVPAYFNDNQKNATKDAGIIAGINVLKLINEPTAAALAYGLNNKVKEKENILVFDLGGGTFDVSLLTLEEGILKVRATAGNNNLGGDDIDNVLAKWIIEEIQKESGVDISDDLHVMARIRDAAENAKIELSGMEQTHINIPSVYSEAGHTLNFSRELSRSRFNSLIKKIIEQTIEPTKDAIQQSKLLKSEINEIVMVGGSTRIPYVQDLVRDMFNGKTLNHTINPDEVVAQGAAIHAAALSSKVDKRGEGSNSIILVDVIPLSVGIEDANGRSHILVPRNSAIPTVRKEVFTNVYDNQPVADIHITQGERKFAADNETIGRFTIEIQHCPKGTAQIEVTFEINSSGILVVSACDLRTKKQRSITIQKKQMSKEDIEKAIQEAQKWEEDDKKRETQVSFKNQIEYLTVEIQDLKSNNKDLDADTIKELDSIQSEASELLKQTDQKIFSEKYADLSNRFFSIVSKVNENKNKEENKEEENKEENKESATDNNETKTEE